MEPNKQFRWRQGFTLVEMLAVTAILIILLGVSAVGVVYYARWLKITELDNAAREIYLAAENRAVLLSGSGRLENLVEIRGKGMTVNVDSGPDGAQTAPGYYIHHSGGAEVADLLPAGTIDPALMDGCFYIVYEPEGGSVTDVFYAEGEPNVGGNFQTFYQEVSTSARSARMRMEPMVGYYGGGTAENAKDDALGTPIVIIKNEETLTAEITYAVLPSMADKAVLTAVLTYDGCEIDISPDPAALSREEKDGRVRFSCTILLDSLDGPNFSDLFKYTAGRPGSFGGDFTVTATLTAQGATPSSGSDTDNSLFAEGSGGETAYIANLRHLQNLNKDISRVDGKTGAEQKNDIDCAAYLGKDYTFVPIQNDKLSSYNGREFVLRGLRAQENGAGSGAGLFADAAGTPEQPWQFQNIRMVNASVHGTGSAGALVGSARNAAFKNCWVYWEPEAGSAGLRGVLGDNENGYNYQIAGSSAGGLAGLLTGEGTIQNCLSATLVQGKSMAGGLVGTAADTVAITNSYADCYLSGAGAGGLAGTAETLTLQNCYAAGFIEITEIGAGLPAAGLCTAGTVTGTSVYSVMRCSGAEEKWEPLAPGMTGTNCYYLSSAMSSEADERAKTYTEMTSEGFASVLGGSFGGKDQDSHPYNLRTDLALTVYDFPGLTALPHYGDWSAQFVEASLVYYEQYQVNQYGFYGGGVDALKNTQPIKDGYAIAIRQEGDAQTDLKVTIAGQEYEYKSENLHPVTGADGTVYRLAPLPDELVNTDSVSEDFYQSLRFTIGDETHDYYYCPHFAKTAVKTDEMPPAPTGVSVRTPRHLYMLSLYPEYYNGRYSFHQELDLDYAVYTGYKLFPEDFTQVPIGRVDEPFNGLYDGGCRVIKNLVFSPLANTTRAYAGLFGYSSGTLRNIVYLMDPDRQNTVSLGNHSNLYIGGLAGGNAGSVINCAVAGVSLTGNAYTASIYIGGLVGLNQGEISGCGAECAALAADTSNYAHAYVGGLVGLNRSSGIITVSYAVGRASAEADTTSAARVCGFVGYNQGLVQNSYAAMDLSSSGKAVETYGFCGVTDGTQSGTFFLNTGNFTYRDISYNASYTPRKAAQIDYAALTDRTASPVAGMTFAAAGGFPYPTAVRDAAGQPVHYGQWPELMELGIMGVYYWETLEINGEAPTYHLVLLAVDSDKKTVSRLTTLSTAHSDNGVVTDYGYGYYYTASENTQVAIELAAKGINYSQQGAQGDAFSTGTAAEDSAVNAEFAKLMPGYEFHSYHSFGMEKDGGGLYPAGSPNGWFILTRKVGSTTDTVMEFAVNPHFADALSVTLPQGWMPAGGASGEAPGSTQGSPYEVRAVSQLQNINWNGTNCGTDTVIEGDKNCLQFPYLSTSNSTGKYYWLQTHDLNGNNETQTPIAEYHDESGGNTGNLYGWFGGTYDGDGYVIENINIKGQKSSCAGLFGIVYNGTLKDIILYSSDGKGTVTSGHNTGTQSRWYAIGALAAVAASDSDSALQNCAVAGYTIEANTYVYAAGTGDAWGGVEIGGLVGISNMALENCSAHTKIHIPGTARSGNDNMRVGGLVGAGLKTITNCYAGGQIIIDPMTKVNGYPGVTAKGVYIGGIIGGSYFKPLQPNLGTLIGPTALNKTSNELTNCYSYVTLPAYKSNDYIKGLYVLGGTGEINQTTVTGDAANHGTCTITNCYYLDSIEPDLSQVPKMGTSNTQSPAFRSDVKSYNTIEMNYARLDVTKLTYAQLAGTAPIGGRDIYDLLTAFSPVTSHTDDGFSVSGKYSYSSARNLQGLNYPFPTILTREGVYHVHYGDWPLCGIKRENGGAPIELDLFTKPDYTETLELDGVNGGGAWSAKSGDENIADVECTDGKLTVTGTGVGVTTLTVTYTLDGVNYTLPLSVNVTAVLELRTPDSPVRLFTNDTVGVKLTAYGERQGEGNEQELDLNALGVTVTAAAGVYDSALLEAAEVDDDLILQLTTGSAEGDAAVSINYTYTYRGVEYTGMSAITIQLTEPEIRTDEDGTILVVFKGGKIDSAVVTSENMDEVKLSIDAADPSMVSLDVPPGETVTVEAALTMDGREHVVTVTFTAEEKDGEQGEAGGGTADAGTK